MELSCVECGAPIERPGTRGPIPRFCAEHRRLRKNAGRRKRYWKDPAAGVRSARAWAVANPERKKATAAAWYAKDPARHAARRKEWRTANPKGDWAAYIKRRYHLTVDRYESLLSAQGGACAIPGCEETEGRQGKPLFVDHDHSCCPGVNSCGSCIRGLLCGNHNAGLGQFQDDSALLRAAADYLEQTRLAVAS